MLEPRLALANLALSSIELVDGNGQQIAAPIIGQQVFYRARWTATGLASSATYLVKYTVGGVSVDSSPLTLGNGTFSWYRGTTYASPGTHQVSITVDGDNGVAESNESDNTLTTSFTPVLPGDLPQRFTFPVAGVPHRDYSIGNYVDVDPRSGSREDFRGGPFQYDGHDAIDAGPATFGDQDRGVPILAAAAGTVTEVVDGHFDRETSMSSRPGNYVRIDHGNGWQTSSWHFAAHSIVVKAGDAVAQGQLLGLMGSSGSSTFSHLHWNVRYRGASVETFYAPTSYWVSPPTYQGDAPPTVMRSGISNYDIGSELAEGPSSVTVFPTAQNWSAWYWYRLSNLPLNARMTVTWFRPDGSVHTTVDRSPEGRQPSVWYWNIGTAWKNVPGTWSAAVSVNGVELDRQSFTVVSSGGEPEATIYQGSALIVDGRVTPIDFGSISAGAAAVERTFTITNRGAAVLTTALAPLPPGFSLVGGFPASVPANGSAAFTVRLDTAVVGRKFGEIRIDTNDRDEAESTFLVSGEVTGTAPPGTPVVTLPGPAVPYLVGSGPVVIDIGGDVSDADAATWSGAALRAEILTNGTAADRLAVRHQGTGAGQVGVAGGAISYGGQQVATAAGGVGTTPLVISFTQAATLPAVRAVLRALTYANVATSPEVRARFLGVSVSDASGAASERQVKRVSSMAGGVVVAVRPS
ncbi:MAG TPA: hypothetical protein DC048_14610, partial [Planctomycetaceae bacterium]|nr:hypothetical protein [Planctomycetaceae bacterium]